MISRGKEVRVYLHSNRTDTTSWINGKLEATYSGHTDEAVHLKDATSLPIVVPAKSVIYVEAQ